MTGISACPVVRGFFFFLFVIGNSGGVCWKLGGNGDSRFPVENLGIEKRSPR